MDHLHDRMTITATEYEFLNLKIDSTAYSFILFVHNVAIE